MTTHLLLKTLQARHDFSQEEFQKFLPLLQERFIQKNEMLFRQDTFVKHLCFVLKGCMRQYHMTLVTITPVVRPINSGLNMYLALPVYGI